MDDNKPQKMDDLPDFIIINTKMKISDAKRLYPDHSGLTDEELFKLADALDKEE